VALEKEALETGIQAYIYGYPLVMMGQTLRVSTNVATPEGTSAPMGQFAHVREYPTPEYKTVVAPNADTLYSVLWLDVAKEPWIVSVPDMKGRYFMLPLLDGWTTVFAVPGTRTTGPERRNSQSPAPTGREHFRRGSRSTSRRPP
jgi:hypothetical protein